jgi:putative ABC transport system permease protein
MIKIWFRSLIRYKLYTFINIAGLSLGICAVVAIFVYITDELSYDQFQANAGRIYRINVTNQFETESRWPTSAGPIAEAIRNDLTSAEKIARIFTRQASIEVVNKGGTNTKFREDNAWFADPDVLQMLTFNFIAGDANTALAQPDRLVIARSVAERYFGSPEKAIGSDILFEGTIPMVISGVYEDLPSQSYFEATVIAHFENYYNLESENIQQYLREDWIYNPLQTFVLLKPGVDPQDFEKQLLTLRDKYGDERVKKVQSYHLQKLTDVYLRSDFNGEQPRIQNLYILASIGFIILVIACVNFINLANVHSLKRAREIGIRKVLGAQKRGLIAQFLAESGALVLISFFIGIVALYILLPYVNSLSGKNFSITDLADWKILFGIAALFLITSFLSGTYPAFYITRFNPVFVLKRTYGQPRQRGFLPEKSVDDNAVHDIYRARGLVDRLLATDGICEQQAARLSDQQHHYRSFVQRYSEFNFRWRCRWRHACENEFIRERACEECSRSGCNRISYSSRHWLHGARIGVDRQDQRTGQRVAGFHGDRL